MGDESEDRLAKVSKIWEIRSKIAGMITTVLFGLCTVYFSYLQLEKSKIDKCAEQYRSSMEFAGRFTGRDYELKGVLSTLLSGCYDDARINQLVALAAKPEEARQLPGTRPPSDEPPQTAKSVPAGVERWIAVGFLPADTNFELPRGKSLNGLASGDVVTALTDVNVRKSPADWTTPLYVVKAGQKVTITETRSLKAGDLSQIWAKLK